jgi:hypothetical protein
MVTFPTEAPSDKILSGVFFALNRLVVLIIAPLLPSPTRRFMTKKYLLKIIPYKRRLFCPKPPCRLDNSAAITVADKTLYD